MISASPGWITVHNQVNGTVGPLIGMTHLGTGVNLNILVQVDPKLATPVLYAVLHVDAGTSGVFEYPGPDVTVVINGVMQTFPFKASTGRPLLPQITVHSQAVSAEKVTVDQVQSVGPGWVAIRTVQPNGQPGSIIGISRVPDGDSSGVTVSIDGSKVTPKLLAELFIDAGEVGTFENPGADLPASINGQVVGQTFNSTPGADITATAASGTVTASPGAGTPAPTSGTPAPGSPTADASPVPTWSGTPSNVTPSVKVTDQVLKSWVVTINDVASRGPGWIVIYSTSGSTPDQDIGHAPVHDGDNPNVSVKIDGTRATGALFALLHSDAGQPGVYENPGADVAVVTGARLAGATFKVRLYNNLPTPTRTVSPSGAGSRKITPGLVVTTPAIIVTTPATILTTAAPPPPPPITDTPQPPPPPPPPITDTPQPPPPPPPPPTDTSQPPPPPPPAQNPPTDTPQPPPPPPPPPPSNPPTSAPAP